MNFEDLTCTFLDHSTQWEKQRLQHLEEFKKNNPNTPVPSHLEDVFCISQALMLMCQEIDKLNKEVTAIKLRVFYEKDCCNGDPLSR